MKALIFSIDDRHDDCDKEDKMNNAEVKEMECRRRQRRLRSAMLLPQGWGRPAPAFLLTT